MLAASERDVGDRRQHRPRSTAYVRVWLEEDILSTCCNKKNVT